MYNNNYQLQFVYSNTIDMSNNILMQNYHQLPTIDFSLNDTPQDHFMYLIDLAIEYGDINYINDAINQYSNIVNSSYIDTAKNIMMQIIEEQLQEISV